MFIIALIIISKYSAVLKPVVNAMQAKTVVSIAVGEHITRILDLFQENRKDADRITSELLKRAQDIATDMDIDHLPLLAKKLKHRSNPPSENDNEYWWRSLIIPYID